MGLLRAHSIHLTAVMLLFLLILSPKASLPQAPSLESGVIAEPAVRIVEPIDENRLVMLTGNTPAMARARFDKGRVDPALRMGDLVLVLRRDEEQQLAFDRFVASQYDPSSPNYHRWLTPDEVGEKFGPSRPDVDALLDWLSGHGFEIDEVTGDRLSIRFSGAAAQIESAFHTQVHNLELRGEKHVSNMTDPQIPAALAPVVVGVKALHNFFPRPQHRMGGQVTLDVKAGTWRRISSPASSLGEELPWTARPEPQFGTANSYGDVVEDVAPYDFAKIYNVLPLWQAGTPIDGTGQKIAIAGTSNINLADVAAFRKAFGLPAKAPSVVITNNDPGACPSFADSCSSDLVENTLDVEWAGAVAKGASIVLVTSSAPTPTSDPLYLSESYIVEHKTAPVMNVSYGECELVLGAAGNTEYNNLWQSAASEGIAVFVASGDAGSPSCDQGFDAVDGVPYAAQFGLSVSGLASTPYDTSVGGTDFNWGATAEPYWSASNASATGASALGYIPEVPWNSTCANPLALPGLQADAAYIGVSGVIDAESACNFVGESAGYISTNFGVNLFGLVDTIGGGGGVSNCIVSDGSSPESCTAGYPRPAWQTGVTGIPANNARNLPDLSFFASNGFLGSAYLICVSGGGNACAYSATAEPVAQEVGGTSVASPAMAGVMALINQKSGAAQGNPNTKLYALASRQSYSACSAEKVKTSSAACIFNDIDTGTNAMACVSGSLECTTLYAGDPAGILSGFSAGLGYDQATGLGSVNVANLVNNWPGVAPFVSLSSASVEFAATTEGKASASQIVTLKNTGKSALSLSGANQGISIKGTNAASFTQANSCGKQVLAGNSCAITVTFKPEAAGALKASIDIADSAYGSPQSVALSGTGKTPAPIVTLSADALTFSLTTIGATNTAPAITLKNTGTAALSLTGVRIVGVNAKSFSQTNQCQASVAVGASCPITVSFKPTASGTLTASLTFVDNAAGSPQTIALSGKGGASTSAKPAHPLAPDPAMKADSHNSATARTDGNLSTLQAQIVRNDGRLPLRFEVNRGQADRSAKFLSRGQGYGLYFTANEAVLALRNTFKPIAGAQGKIATDVIRMQLAGASHENTPAGEDLMAGVSNYLVGNDPSQWHTQVPSYSRVRYAGVYPGIDLVYYGNQQQLEYDFVVSPGADPGLIHLHFDGARDLKLDKRGDLVIRTEDGELAFHKPEVYQRVNGARRSIRGRFSLLAGNSAGFVLGHFDSQKPLIIDPTLVYSTFLGGSNSDSVTSIAVDLTGAAYLTGTTTSTDFPVTPGVIQAKDKDTHATAFVTKLNASGTALIYSTFLGGSGSPSGGDVGAAISVNSSGDAYVTGSTYSTDFPVTTGAFQTTNKAAAGSGSTGFVSQLNANGTALVYSTFLGGSLTDNPTSLALDSSGSVYLTGFATSTDFPTTTGAFQATNKSAGVEGWNAFVTKLNPTGAALIYSTYLGGSDEYSSPGTYIVAIDKSGDAYVSGIALSTDFPVTTGAYQTVNNAGSGHSDMTLSKLNPTATALIYSTYLGGSGSPYGDDSANGLALDSSGNAYLAGSTHESNFPVTKGAFQSTSSAVGGGLSSGFVTKMNPAGTALVYSTYLGGSGNDRANALAADSSGDVYVTGSAGSTDFPVTKNAYQSQNNAAFNNDAVVFLTELSPAGNSLIYSTYMGGANSFSDAGNGLALGSGGGVYLAGIATAADFPVTSNAYQTAFNSAQFETGFVAEFTLGTASTTIPTTTTLTASEDPAVTGTKISFSVAVVPNTGTAIPTGNVVFAIDEKNVTKVALNSKGWATYVTPTALAPGQHAILASYSGNATYSASGSGLTESITAATPTISPAAGAYPAAQLVTIADSTPGAIIYYTLNGSAPSASSTRYEGTILVSNPETVKAVALLSNAPNSGVAEASYRLITAPTALAAPATAVRASGAILNALVDTYGMSGAYYFEYGTSGTALTSTTPTMPLHSSVLGSELNFVPVPVSYSIANLKSNTTYYYHVVVSTPAGSSSGEVLSFVAK